MKLTSIINSEPRRELEVDALHIFNTYLKERNLNLTRQREEVLVAFLGAESHISAEQLAENLKAQRSAVGLSTVYRTLKLLVECELAEERRFGSDVTLYEPTLHHHEHLICTACHCIVEFENEELEQLKARIAEAHGFKMLRHTLHLYGLCQACQKEAPLAVAGI